MKIKNKIVIINLLNKNRIDNYKNKILITLTLKTKNNNKIINNNYNNNNNKIKNYNNNQNKFI